MSQIIIQKTGYKYGIHLLIIVFQTLTSKCPWLHYKSIEPMVIWENLNSHDFLKAVIS